MVRNTPSEGVKDEGGFQIRNANWSACFTFTTNMFPKARSDILMLDESGRWRTGGCELGQALTYKMGPVSLTIQNEPTILTANQMKITNHANLKDPEKHQASCSRKVMHHPSSV